MKTNLPVYKIQHFKESLQEKDFYANCFRSHISQHHIASSPHKHDFFLVVLITAGKGIHEIDFTTYEIKPGSIFMMSPGQMHQWSLSKDIDGYVFFHTKDFYDKAYNLSGVMDFPFFSSIYNLPFIFLKKKQSQIAEHIFKEIIEEYKSTEHFRFEKIHALLTILYIDLSRNYLPSVKVENQNYLLKLRKLEGFIDKYFKSKKYPAEYANLMHLSEKHLNRISKECLNKTSSELIAERILLEAKRMLIHSKYTITEVAFELGYDDPSYFSRFFKKHSGETPMAFSNRYKHQS